MNYREISSDLQICVNGQKKQYADSIQLIASENYPSQAVLDLMGSCLSAKYSEGYPGKRHYGGCSIVDEVEQFAIDKACELFKCDYANVQPWSGSQANQAVYLAFLKPHEVILSMSLSSGAHLTHGSRFTSSGKFYVHKEFDLDENNEISMILLSKSLKEHQPRMLIMGYSAYSRKISFAQVREEVDRHNTWLWLHLKEMSIGIEEAIVEETYESKKCLLMVDMAHFAGIVAASTRTNVQDLLNDANLLWEDECLPFPYADVVTSTTHKTLRGPRGGLILWNDESFTNKINHAVFPGIQGGANQATIAAKAQCFIEALDSEFKRYINNVLRNTQALIRGLLSTDDRLKVVTGGSDNHMILLDLKGINLLGSDAESALESVDIICNKNLMPGDKKPAESSAIRLGTAAMTSRGFTEQVFEDLGVVIAKVLAKAAGRCLFYEDKTVYSRQVAGWVKEFPLEY